jgi:hypothetical protein
MQGGVALRTEYNLRHSLPVAQMNKNDSAQIAPPVHPAHHQGTLALVAGAQCSTVVCPAEVAQKVQGYLLRHGKTAADEMFCYCTLWPVD